MEAAENGKDTITLKWGTFKAWHLKTPRAQELMQRYQEIGVSLSAMAQRDTPEQKALICEIIDASNADEIYLSWDGVYVSKEKAKEYVLNYGQ